MRKNKSPSDASNSNLRLKDLSFPREVAGSKTAIVAIGDADIQELFVLSLIALDVRAHGGIAPLVLMCTPVVPNCPTSSAHDENARVLSAGAAKLAKFNKAGEYIQFH